MSGLAGWRVIVTRSSEQASELASLLEAEGAVPVLLDTIGIRPPADGGAALAAAGAVAAEYDWIVFTSPNAAARTVPHLVGAIPQVAAIGPGTAAVLAELGVPVDLVARRHVAEGVLAEFPAPAPAPASGAVGRVLLPQAAGARAVVAEGLRAIGYEVDVVEAYRTETSTPDPEQLIAAGGADAVTFTSSSTVRGFLDVAGVELLPPVVACIGPVTSATVAELGLHVDVVAEDHSLPGLVAALRAFADLRSGASS